MNSIFIGGTLQCILLLRGQDSISASLIAHGAPIDTLKGWLQEGYDKQQLNYTSFKLLVRGLSPREPATLFMDAFKYFEWRMAEILLSKTMVSSNWIKINSQR
jgi:hypothetical protein